MLRHVLKSGGTRIFAILAVLIVLGGSKPVQATPWQVYEIRNAKAVGQVNRPATSVWGLSNNLPGGVLTLTQTLTVSNECSLGVGVTSPMASATLGFNVAASWANNYQYQTGPIPRGKLVQIQAYNVYQGFSYDIWMTPAFAAPNQAQKVGSGTALKFIGVRYVVTVTPR